MKAEVFLDTAYAIALSSPNDLFHQQAVQLADELKISRHSIGYDPRDNA